MELNEIRPFFTLAFQRLLQLDPAEAERQETQEDEQAGDELQVEEEMDEGDGDDVMYENGARRRAAASKKKKETRDAAGHNDDDDDPRAEHMHDYDNFDLQ